MGMTTSFRDQLDEKLSANGVDADNHEHIAANGSTASDAAFRGFIENLPVMFYAVDAAAPHTPLYISPTFEEFGYPLSEWLTKPDIWDRVMHPEDRDHVLGLTRDAMTRGESTDFEYRIVCKDGRIVWVRDRGCFVKDKNGKLLCWQGVIINITQRRLAEQELQVGIVQHAPPEDGVSLDADGVGCSGHGAGDRVVAPSQDRRGVVLAGRADGDGGFRHGGRLPGSAGRTCRERTRERRRR